MVERPRLLEVHTEAPAGDIDRRQPTLVIELPDRPNGPVGDVQGAVALSKLDPVADGEAAWLQPDHLERPAFLWIDDRGKMALELQPQEVLSLVDADDSCSLPCFDPVPWAHESKHIAHLIA